MGSEHDVGYPYLDYVNARSDGNVLDRGVSDMSSCTLIRKEKSAGWRKHCSLAYRQLKRTDKIFDVRLYFLKTQSFDSLLEKVIERLSGT